MIRKFEINKHFAGVLFALQYGNPTCFQNVFNSRRFRSVECEYLFSIGDFNCFIQFFASIQNQLISSLNHCPITNIQYTLFFGNDSLTITSIDGIIWNALYLVIELFPGLEFTEMVLSPLLCAIHCYVGNIILTEKLCPKRFLYSSVLLISRQNKINTHFSTLPWFTVLFHIFYPARELL